MSRHRHVRNMRHEDYDDFGNDDPFDDDHDAEPDQESSAYLWRPPTAPTPAADAPLISDLAAQFRLCLNDNTLQEPEIDAAIIAADYDVDAALHLLRSQLQLAAAATRSDAQRLELRQPSPIGQMLEAEEGGPVAAPRLPREQGDAGVHVAVESGAALPVGEGGKVSPFRFDRPSPDDIVRAKQEGVGGRGRKTLRMPKASALGGAKKGRAGVAVADPVKGTAPSKGKEEKVDEERAERAGGRAAQTALALPTGSSGGGAQKVVKQRTKKIDYAKIVNAGCTSASVVVAGHVDAGKSTLLGHFLPLLEAREGAGESRTKRRQRKPQDLAWGTDEDGVERERGVTIDIATRVFKTDGANGRTYAMIDAPGHRDFVPAMILGATQASAALLVVDASPGEFEAGFSEDGQTREHALVLKSLGVAKLIVVVNKMDVAEYAKERFEEIVKAVTSFLKGNGWKMPGDATFIAAAGREGLNLIAKPDTDHPMMQWYDGKSLLEAIEELPTIDASVVSEVSSGPTRLVVSDFFRSATLGGTGAVTGRLLCGTIAPKDKLLICPGGAVATVKNLEVGDGLRRPVAVAGVDSLPVSLGLTELTDGIIIAAGNVLCDPEAPVPVVSRFRAQLMTVTTATPLIQGTRAVLHVGGGAEAASISKLCEYVFARKASGSGGKKRKPRRLVKGEAAVVEISCDRAVAMEAFKTLKSLGRFALRQKGRTVAVGVVLEILETEKRVVENSGGQDSGPST